MSEAAVEVPNVGQNAVSGFGEPLRGTDEVVPNISGAVITEPADGSTVPAVFDITGTGTPGAEVTLWYEFLDPAGPAQSTEMTKTVRQNGTFAYTGSTPSDPGLVQWWVVSGEGTSPRVTVTVEAAEPEK